MTMRYSRASSCACSLTSGESGCSVTAMRKCAADAFALALAELGPVQCADRRAADAAGQHGRLAVELGDDADRRELAVAAGGDDDPRGAVRSQCVIDGGACLVTGDRNRDRHVREDHTVVEREEWEDGGADVSAHVEGTNALGAPSHSALDTNMRSLYHRTHVRFALSPPPRLRRSAPSSASSHLPCSCCRARPRAPIRRASMSSVPARPCGRSRAPSTAVTRSPTSARSPTRTRSRAR